MEKHQGFIFSVREVIKELVKAGKLPGEASHKVWVGVQRDLDDFRVVGMNDRIKFEVG